ncbi:MAG: cytochrome c, partial [Candidatus Promineifilaceae bacterium]
AQVTFYDYQTGAAVEAIVTLAAKQVIAGWMDYDALPGASRQVLPRAWAIASADKDVTAIIGNVRTAEPVMIPMSTWMLEGPCQFSWCVDLTFMAPDQSGRVYHVLIDMEAEEVAQTFYSRGLADRTYSRPPDQGISYNNGCREQYGWSVCWEMTANDGINFYDASFIGRTVFSSAKISQVEVYYPAWPGGYRDEIGYGSTVPPYYGTNITDLGNGFEVEQLYTEFLRWPNCVCCYRYEQIMRFYADGSFETDFVSHGPGCDNDSTYRPFWRIDMDQTGPEDDQVWYWSGNQWQEGLTESDIALFDNLSLDGYRLFTAGGGLQYYWQPVKTDPRGLDDGRLFLLQFHEEEGVGPIAPGPADTFFPPRSYENGEEVSGGNYVIWYVPILNTSRVDPYWCMPEPAPDFSPCDAVLRVIPGGALDVQPEVVPTPTADSTAPPTNTSSPTEPTATPRPVAGEDAPTIIFNAGCGVCHQIDTLELEGSTGPDLSNAADWAGQRASGLTAAEYIRQSILEPGAFIASNCPDGPCRDEIMPGNYSERLTTAQIDIIVQYLLNQGISTTTPGAYPALPPAISQGTSYPALPQAIGQGISYPAATPSGTSSQSPVFNAPILVIVFVTTFVIIFGLIAGYIFVRKRNKNVEL